MMEERRGMMGRKASVRNSATCFSSIGIENSQTPIIDNWKAELLQYWAIGLTGSTDIPSSNSIYFFLLSLGRLFNSLAFNSFKYCYLELRVAFHGLFIETKVTPQKS